jgi:signal transduction histidine kinase
VSVRADSGVVDRHSGPGARPLLFPTGLTILKALVAGRWLSMAWMTGIVIVDHDQLRAPAVAWIAVAATFSLTAASTWWVRSDPGRLLALPFVAAEVSLAVGLSVVDGIVFEPGHVFETTQSIATQWPLLAAATAGVAFGPVVAAVCGALIGPAELWGAVLNEHDEWGGPEVVSIVATSLFFAAVGGVVGWLANRLRRVEREIADRRARDEVARVLHDTVLQTLALVERRSADADPELATAARRADRDLRAFLFGSVGATVDDLEGRIRHEVERVRGDSEIPLTVSVLDDGCRLRPDDQVLVARAMAEAVANSIEHAAPSRIVVFAETDEHGHVFASVVDDGVGFDPARPRSSHGVDRSIIARIESIGGRAEIRSRPGGGTEVCLWTHADVRASRP